MAGLCRYLLLCNLELDKHIYWADAASSTVQHKQSDMWYCAVMMLIHGYLHRYDAVMMECCMISPVCSTAVLATNMDTAQGTDGFCSTATQHIVNTGHWIGDTTCRGYGTFKLSIQCHLQCVYSRYPHCPYLHTTHNQLEKLEAAKAAWLVCLSLLSLTGTVLGLTGPY